MARTWTRVIVMWPRVIGHVFMEGMALHGACAYAPPPEDQPQSNGPSKTVPRSQTAVLDNDGSTAPLRPAAHGASRTAASERKYSRM
jgi:hypothetical protein